MECLVFSDQDLCAVFVQDVDRPLGSGSLNELFSRPNRRNVLDKRMFGASEDDFLVGNKPFSHW